MNSMPHVSSNGWKGYEEDRQCPITYLERGIDQPNIESHIDQGTEYEKRTRSDGVVEEGTFKNGKLIQGKRTNSIGDVEEVEYRNGQIWNGKGKLTGARGCVEEGEFRNGRLEGKGKITDKDGGIVEGTFRYGKIWNGQGTRAKSNEMLRKERLKMAS